MSFVQSEIDTPELVVAKFGGTSVADYASMSRCADIVLANQATRLVVVSASSGVTNLLVELTQANVNDERRLVLLKQIAQIQYAILDELGRPQDVAASIDKILSRMSVLSESLELNRSKAVMDELLSTGEQCSSILFSAVIREPLQIILMCAKYYVPTVTLVVQNHKLKRFQC